LAHLRYGPIQDDSPTVLLSQHRVFGNQVGAAACHV
jgi:hypothetical protein